MSEYMSHLLTSCDYRYNIERMCWCAFVWWRYNTRKYTHFYTIDLLGFQLGHKLHQCHTCGNCMSIQTKDNNTNKHTDCNIIQILSDIERH